MFNRFKNTNTHFNRFLSRELVLDADAERFILATGITDSTIILAVNNLVLSLKSYSVWNKCLAIYPMVGGTATTHKFNLKDPQDANASYRLSFSGGWTHNSNGATPNGINGYADTFIIPANVLSLNSVHISFYSETDTAAVMYEMGCRKSDNTNLLGLLSKYSDNKTYIQLNVNSGASIAVADSYSFFIANRTSSNVVNGWKAGSKIINVTDASVGLADVSIYIGASNKSNAVYSPSTRQCAFSTIGQGLTDTEATNLYTAVQAFQTALSRNK